MAATKITHTGAKGITIASTGEVSVAEDLSSASPVTGASFVVGSWTITEDGSGNLLFSSGGTPRLRLNADGSLQAAANVQGVVTL